MTTDTKKLWIAFFLLAIIWIIPGLVGHEPWKPDEGYSFGLVSHVYRTGDMVVPTLAGEPFMEKPPLYYCTATVFLRAFSSFLPPHDAARLTSGFFIAITLLCLGLSCRELFGANKSWYAPAILLGCLGLPEFAHQLITDTSLLAGFSIALYGWTLSLRRPVLAGVVTAGGLVVGFLSKGLLAPGIIGITTLLLPICFKSWRTRDCLLYFLSIAVVALPLALIWPIALYLRSPTLFRDWFWINNFGRFFGFARLGPKFIPGDYFEMIIWMGWPALPLSIWTLFQRKRAGFHQSAIQIPLLSFAVTIIVLSLAANVRQLYAIPMLLPLSLLAAGALDQLTRSWSLVLKWMGIIAFGALALALWLGWLTMLTGIPSSIAERLIQGTPAYHPTFVGWAFWPAIVITAAWIVMAFYTGTNGPRVLLHWSAGLAMVWLLAMTLWLPLLDSSKSYRSMMNDVKAVLPTGKTCIASINLGEPQRALLEYYAGILTHRKETIGIQPTDDYLIVQGSCGHPPKPPNADWKKIWEGQRPGDKKEIYCVYQRRL